MELAAVLTTIPKTQEPQEYQHACKALKNSPSRKGQKKPLDFSQAAEYHWYAV